MKNVFVDHHDADQSWHWALFLPPIEAHEWKPISCSPELHAAPPHWWTGWRPPACVLSFPWRSHSSAMNIGMKEHPPVHVVRSMRGQLLGGISDLFTDLSMCVRSSLLVSWTLNLIQSGPSRITSQVQFHTETELNLSYLLFDLPYFSWI